MILTDDQRTLLIAYARQRARELNYDLGDLVPGDNEVYPIHFRNFIWESPEGEPVGDYALRLLVSEALESVSAARGQPRPAGTFMHQAIVGTPRTEPNLYEQGFQRALATARALEGGSPPAPIPTPNPYHALSGAVETDIIGGFAVASPACLGCGALLRIEHAWMADGCPCNSAGWNNSLNEHRWRLLMELQQQQSRELAELHQRVALYLDPDGPEIPRLQAEIQELRQRGWPTYPLSCNSVILELPL